MVTLAYLCVCVLVLCSEAFVVVVAWLFFLNQRSNQFEAYIHCFGKNVYDFYVGDQIKKRVQLSNPFWVSLQVLPPQMRFTPWGTSCFCCTTSCCMSASRGSSTRCATAGSCAKSSKPRPWRSTMLPWWAGTQLHQWLRHTGAAESVNWPGWCLLVPLS